MRLLMLVLFGLGAAGPLLALERVAMPPVLPSLMGGKIVSECEMKLAKMTDGACPQACMMKVPPGDVATTPVCTLTAKPWQCVWPRRRVDQRGLCPAGWDGTLQKQALYEVRRCGAELVLLGQSVRDSQCSRRRLVPETRACPSGWQGDGVTYDTEVTERLGDDLRTVTPLGTVVLPLRRPSQVQCFKETTTETQEPCPGQRGTQRTVRRTLRQQLGLDLVTAATTTTVAETATTCPPVTPPTTACNATSPGARCAQSTWVGGNRGTLQCLRWVCPPVNNAGHKLGAGSDGNSGRSHDTGEHGNRFGGAGGKF